MIILIKCIIICTNHAVMYKCNVAITLFFSLLIFGGFFHFVPPYEKACKTAKTNVLTDSNCNYYVCTGAYNKIFSHWALIKSTYCSSPTVNLYIFTVIVYVDVLNIISRPLQKMQTCDSFYVFIHSNMIHLSIFQWFQITWKAFFV